MAATTQRSQATGEQQPLLQQDQENGRIDEEVYYETPKKWTYQWALYSLVTLITGLVLFFFVYYIPFVLYPPPEVTDILPLTRVATLNITKERPYRSTVDIQKVRKRTRRPRKARTTEDFRTNYAGFSMWDDWSLLSEIPNTRIIMFGDVHGSYDELKEMLDIVNYTHAKVPEKKDEYYRDHVVLLGDFVSKGPDSIPVVELALNESFSCVRGNHEEIVLEKYAKFHHLPYSSVNLTKNDSDTRPKKRRPHNSTTVPETPIDTESIDDDFTIAVNKGSEKWIARHATPAHIRYISSCPSILELGPFGLNLKVPKDLIESKEIENDENSKEDAPDDENFISNADYSTLKGPRVKYHHMGSVQINNKFAKINRAVAVHAGLQWNIEKLQDQNPIATFSMRTLGGSDFTTPYELNHCQGPIEMFPPEDEQSKGDSSNITPENAVCKNWAGVFNKHQKLDLPERNRTTVFYGHDASRGLNLHRFTKGVDTGCVYGARLTAYIITITQTANHKYPLVSHDMVSLKCKSYV